MSIDPNKAFGMKATNKSYTLEFRREDNGSTTLSATDMETVKMTFGQRLSAAWSILTGKKTIGELVFPIRLRSIDFYHMSYIFRPEKVVEKKADAKASVAKPAAENPAAKTAKPKKASETATSAKPKKEKVVAAETVREGKPRAPRKPKSNTVENKA